MRGILKAALVAACAFAMSTPALAGDRASGQYRSESGDLQVLHGAAALFDDVEGFNDGKPYYRIILAAVPVDPAFAIRASATVGVDLAAALDQPVLLIEVDQGQADGNYNVAFPARGDSRPLGFGNLSLSSLSIADGRIKGEGEARDLTVSFDLPLLARPPAEVFSGAKARNSEVFKRHEARFKALADGKLDLALSYAVEAKREQLRAVFESMGDGLRQRAKAMLEESRKGDCRVITRGDVAVIRLGEMSMEAVRVNGAWLFQ